MSLQATQYYAHQIPTVGTAVAESLMIQERLLHALHNDTISDADISGQVEHLYRNLVDSIQNIQLLMPLLKDEQHHGPRLRRILMGCTDNQEVSFQDFFEGRLAGDVDFSDTTSVAAFGIDFSGTQATEPSYQLDCTQKMSKADLLPVLSRITVNHLSRSFPEEKYRFFEKRGVSQCTPGLLTELYGLSRFNPRDKISLHDLKIHLDTRHMILRQCLRNWDRYDNQRRHEESVHGRIIRQNRKISISMAKEAFQQVVVGTGESLEQQEYADYVGQYAATAQELAEKGYFDVHAGVTEEEDLSGDDVTGRPTVTPYEMSHDGKKFTVIHFKNFVSMNFHGRVIEGLNRLRYMFGLGTNIHRYMRVAHVKHYHLHHWLILIWQRCARWNRARNTPAHFIHCRWCQSGGSGFSGRQRIPRLGH